MFNKIILENKIPTLQEIKQTHAEIRNVNDVHQESLSSLDKFALWMTNRVGTIGFFIIIFIWTVFWLGWNAWGPDELRFDPFPGFVLWLFIANVIQISLMPLIMVGQNLQSKYAETRSDAEFEINKKSEKEIETILLRLEKQEELIVKLLEKNQEKD